MPFFDRVQQALEPGQIVFGAREDHAFQAPPVDERLDSGIELVKRKNDFTAGIRDLRFDFKFELKWIDRRHKRPSPDAPVIGNDGLREVRKHNADHAAFSNLQRAEGIRELIDEGVQLAIAKSPPVKANRGMARIPSGRVA